jgi:hypothetical protein
MATALSARKRQAVLDSITVQEFKQLLDRFGVMGNAEAAETLGTWQSNLDQIANLPEPFVRVKATRLWVGQEIRDHAVIMDEKRARRKVA